MSCKDGKITPHARKVYHSTIVDTKPSAIARDFVILLLLDELSGLLDGPDKVENSTPLLCPFYTYTTSIMPSALYDLLQEMIPQVTTALVKDILSSYVEIQSMYRANTLRYLEDWQTTVQLEYPIVRVQPQIAQTRAGEEQQHFAFGGSIPAINLGGSLADLHLPDG